MIKIVLLSILVVLSSVATEIQKCETDNIEDVQAKKSMDSWLNSEFGVKPYRVNYILPLGYREGNYKSYVPTDKYKNLEAELQVSLKLNVGNNLFGLDESYYASYTHQAFWQLYSKSSPFRETTYNPELFVIFPISDSDSMFNMKSLKVAYAHRSNGQGSNEDVRYPSGYENPGNRSRSINYLYTTLTFQHETLITELMAWVPIPGSDDDNPDIMDYTGYTSLEFKYFVDKHMITLMGRINAATWLGAVETTYSYPLIDGVYFYGKIFSGYTESLIDYNNYITKFSVGFSFSR